MRINTKIFIRAALCRRGLALRKAAQEAAETARQAFEEGRSAENLPSIMVPKAELDEGLTAIALLVRAGLSPSNSEAKKLIAQGGAKLNDAVITDPQGRIDSSALVDGALKLTAGKKRHILVRCG